MAKYKTPESSGTSSRRTAVAARRGRACIASHSGNGSPALLLRCNAWRSRETYALSSAAVRASAVHANPDFGTLERMPPDGRCSDRALADLIADADSIRTR